MQKVQLKETLKKALRSAGVNGNHVAVMVPVRSSTDQETVELLSGVMVNCASFDVFSVDEWETIVREPSFAALIETEQKMNMGIALSDEKEIFRRRVRLFTLPCTHFVPTAVSLLLCQYFCVASESQAHVYTLRS